MPQDTSAPESLGEFHETSFAWTNHLPDGAVSVANENGNLVLRGSEKLQEQFEALLEARKAGTLTPAENEQYEAICRLDDALSWLNRLARTAFKQS